MTWCSWLGILSTHLALLPPSTVDASSANKELVVEVLPAAAGVVAGERGKSSSNRSASSSKLYMYVVPLSTSVILLFHLIEPMCNIYHDI